MEITLYGKCLYHSMSMLIGFRRLEKSLLHFQKQRQPCPLAVSGITAVPIQVNKAQLLHQTQPMGKSEAVAEK